MVGASQYASCIPIVGELVKTTLEIIGKALICLGEYSELPDYLNKAKNKLI